MKYPAIAVLLMGAGAVQAAVYSLPVVEEQLESTAALHRRSQTPLGPSRSSGSQPIDSRLALLSTLYTTPLTLGTPPQSFTALLTLQRPATLFVPSTACPTCTHGPLYDSTASSTHHPNGSALSLPPPGPWNLPDLTGIVSTDTLRLAAGALEVREFAFMEANTSVARYFGDAFSSVLSLAVGAPGLPGPFEALLDAGTLDAGVVSLALPRDGRPGELLFGGINHTQYTGALTEYKLWPPGTERWQVQLTGMSFVHQNGTPIARKPLRGWAGVLHTALPATALPREFAGAVARAVIDGWGETKCGDVYIPCDRMGEMPVLTIELEGGGELVVGPGEYVRRVEVPWCPHEGELCFPAFGEAGEEDAAKEVWLGPQVLAGVYSVFDWGNRRVQFGVLKE
ncbi:aspartic peptidase domain-containing protein [Geopyxis carbonaria]|nr:aspartic peptidase domain-containing protein [Geopyxis carbonaria]